MRTIDDIRHERLLELIREAGSIQAIANKLGTTHSYVSQLKTRPANKDGDRKSIGTTVARKMEQAFSKPIGWMDTDPRACLGESSDERLQSELPLAPKSRQTAWRAAADRLAEHCTKRHVSLDPETFLLFVDAAMAEMDEEASEAAAEAVLKRWLPVISRGRGVGHASA